MYSVSSFLPQDSTSLDHAAAWRCHPELGFQYPFSSTDKLNLQAAALTGRAVG